MLSNFSQKRLQIFVDRSALELGVLGALGTHGRASGILIVGDPPCEDVSGGPEGDC